MAKSKAFYLKYVGIALVCFVVFLLIPFEKEKEIHYRDFQDIKKNGLLRVATEYNSIGFFAENDTIAGFYYDLINDFASDQDLKVEIIPVMSHEDRMNGLYNGDYDIIASSIPLTLNKDSLYVLTKPLIRSKQVLIQRKPLAEDDSLFINSQIDLGGKTLHVIKGSPAINRIHNMSNEIGDTIYIDEVDKYGQEQLIAMVAHGDIDYAVCSEDIAKTALDDFPQIDINTDIGLNQFYSWAVGSHSPVLLDTLNSWLDSTTQSKQYQELYKKYFNTSY